MFREGKVLYKIQDRMTYMLSEDKISDPLRVCQLLEEEIRPIIENYLCVKGDIKVRFRKESTQNIFFIEINAERIKPFGYIPY